MKTLGDTLKTAREEKELILRKVAAEDGNALVKTTTAR